MDFQFKIRYMIFIIFTIFGIFIIFSKFLESKINQVSETKYFNISSALLPPYITRLGGGHEIKKVKTLLLSDNGDTNIAIHIFPFGRHWEEFIADERYDAVTTVPVNLDLGFYTSDPYISYQNVVATYRNTDIMFLNNDLSFLRGKRVVAFAGAKDILKSINSSVSSFSNYLEEANQREHSVMLKNDIVDVVIADENIFEYYTKEVFKINDIEFKKKFITHRIFDETKYNMVFRDSDVRDRFNANIKTYFKKN